MVHHDKLILRRRALERREAVPAAQAAAFADRIEREGTALATLLSAYIVSAYRPMRGEASPLALLDALSRRGIVTALPVVNAKHTALVFRAWRPGDPLARSAFGVEEPGPGLRVVRPDLLFVPLAAFDRRGHRIGYGAGYYDRTLAALRADGPVTAVGLAYGVQEIADALPQAHDQQLDYVLTEHDLIDTGRT